MRFNSIHQAFENMKTNYFRHAQKTGKVLSEGWDTVDLQKPATHKGAKGLDTSGSAKGMSTPANIEDPDYNPEPIDHFNPTIIGVSTLEKYMDLFDKELGELKEIQQTGTAKE